MPTEIPLSTPSISASVALPRLKLGPLVAGTVFTLVPNLPGVSGDDIPSTAERSVEILSLDKK